MSLNDLKNSAKINLRVSQLNFHLLKTFKPHLALVVAFLGTDQKAKNQNITRQIHKQNLNLLIYTIKQVHIMIKLDKNISLVDNRFIIPSVSVGNAPQLTLDLIIEGLHMKRVGEIFHNSIIPVIGGPSFDHIQSSVSAAEIYQDETTKLAILQLRSPLTGPLMGDFFTKLIEFIKNQKIKETIVLSSAYGYEKHNVTGSNFGYKSHNVAATFTDVPDFGNGRIHGGGFGPKLYQLLVAADLPVLLLFKYVSEGDNAPDAVLTLQKLNEVLKMFDFGNGQSLRQPSSWKFLFGSGPPLQIY